MPNRSMSALDANPFETRNGENRLKQGAVRLLTPAEEFDLVGRLGAMRGKIEKWLAPALAGAEPEARLDHFDQKLAYVSARSETPPAATALRRAAKALEEYRALKAELVTANLPWVAKLARAQRNTAIPEDDLFQEGVCGLLKAIDRFEPERGLRLMTYATWYIREAMQQIRARQTHFVAISSHDQTLLGQLESKQSAFQHEHERLPTAKELGAGLSASPRFLDRLHAATRPAVSLERNSTEGSIPVPIDDPIPEFERQQDVQDAVARLLEVLPERERFIVSRRFGLEGNEATGLDALGANLNVSKERVRQLQRQALRRMQHAAEEAQIEP
ncbi:MAG TPA: sigma-70 family RNA polymerase sigma factor [Planctomycetia bacterium]|nr:sigma-70 family RNA polymerase sigma factor [Planctomycetia bacterium]